MAAASSPLRIDAVAATLAPGLIGLTICPGKKDPHAKSGPCARDLDTDLEAIRSWGAVVLVTLIEDHEFGLLEVPDLGLRARALGLAWHHLPIRDVSIPDGRFEAGWQVTGPRLATVLKEGRRVVVHCRGGLGRSGMVAALLLIEQGVAPGDAIGRVRAARPGAIETGEQERFVLAARDSDIPPKGR